MRHLKLASFGLLSLALPACSQSSAPGSGSGSGAGAASAPQIVDVGSPLYPSEKTEIIGFPDAMETTVVIPGAVVRMDKKQIVAAEVDGRMEIVGTHLGMGAPFDPKDKDIYFDPNDNEKKLPYRRLRVGNTVNKGMTVSLINDLDVLIQIEQAQHIILYSQKAIKEATDGTAKIEESIKRLKDGGGSPIELLNAEATLARYRENIYTSEREMAKAEGDRKRAMLLRAKHRSNAAVTGIITNIMVEPGEVVRAGMPIMEILSLEDVRIEGTMEAAYANNVKPGMRVIIEPTLPVGPDLQAGQIGHRKEVTGLAVTAHPNRPLVVSTSLDGTAVVWDAIAPAGKPKMQWRLVHPGGVSSVAATGPKGGGRQLCATGGDDGRIRIWDLTTPESLGNAKPLAEFAETHATAVVALAFSPDARHLASAAGREVMLWDVATGKKLYSFPGEHKDAVTMVKFTPQAKLVTASRDKTVRVWNVGDKGAGVERTIDHRKAHLDVLGVSSSGGRVLFDSDDGKLDVISLADGQPVGSIQNAAIGARFAVLGLFSPTDEYVLTAGGDGDMRGELQVWATPKPGGRGAEVRRLVTPKQTMPTCAAFGGDPGKGFIAVGTQAGGVHLWPVEMLKGGNTERLGRVISVMRTDPRNVKVRVETNAFGGEFALLQDKSTATLIIRPGDPLMTPALPLPGGIAPAAGAQLPSVMVPE